MYMVRVGLEMGSIGLICVLEEIVSWGLKRTMPLILKKKKNQYSLCHSKRTLVQFRPTLFFFCFCAQFDYKVDFSAHSSNQGGCLSFCSQWQNVTRVGHLQCKLPGFGIQDWCPRKNVLSRWAGAEWKRHSSLPRLECLSGVTKQGGGRYEPCALLASSINSTWY